MRVDRGLTLHLFRRFGAPGRRHVPILMYHSISDDAEDEAGPYYKVVTNPRRFAEQIQWLQEAGYIGVSLEEALAEQTVNGANPRRLAVITFDDGFRDFYTAAWPVLQRRRFTATMYLPTHYISAQRRSFLGRECLTWNEVRELRRKGVQFGSHTVHHPKLYELPWAEIDGELTQSKSRIEQELGEGISSFAYPFAFPQEDRSFVGRLTALLQSCGYQSCVTTMIGRLPPGRRPFLLKRLPVNSCDDQALFTAKLEGAYDWLARPQALTRRAKARIGRTKTRAD